MKYNANKAKVKQASPQTKKELEYDACMSESPKKIWVRREIFMEKKQSKSQSRTKIKSILVPVQKSVSIPSNSNDMVVVTKAKNLVKYVFQVTGNSPKKIRFSFVSKIQSISLELIENLYRASEIPYNKKSPQIINKKAEYLTDAKMSLKLLEYFALLMYECGFFTAKQYEQIAKMGIQCETLTNAWMKKFVDVV